MNTDRSHNLSGGSNPPADQPVHGQAAPDSKPSQSQDIAKGHDPSDSTGIFFHEEQGPASQSLNESSTPGSLDDSLFERYERRSLSTILQQQRAYRESQAAHAASVILEGVDPLDLDSEYQELEVYEEHDPQALGRPKQLLVRVHRKERGLAVLASPGAQVVYVLLIIATLGGIIGLASSTDSPQLVLIAGVATPMLLPLCIWRWVRWLDSAPYYYRLLTTLGEDARNLLGYRLFWKRSDGPGF